MEAQLDRELRFHVEEHAADLLARGIAPDEARRQARMTLGGPEQVKEACRDARGSRWAEDLWQDVRYAWRVLTHDPGYGTMAAATIALGIGATTAILSAVYPILIEPLQYPHAERIATIWYAGQDRTRLAQSFGTYRELASRSRTFEALAVFKPWQPTLTGRAEPERLDGQRVTAEYFRALGVSPTLGHDFDTTDDRANGPNVVILGNAVWRDRFNGDPTIAGRQITLDDTLYTVAGVMPASFENVLSPSAEIWSLLQYDASLPVQGKEWGHHLRMAGRVRAGFSLKQGSDELNRIARSPIAEFRRPPWAAMSQGLIVSGLQEDITRGVRPALLAVAGAVLLLLAIACVNVTNLLLARGARRREELAMRAALGAGRTRLIRQLLAESLLVTLIGGAIGMMVAESGVRAVSALSPPELPRAGAIHLALPVFMVSVGLTTLAGLAVGAAPALQLSREGLRQGIQQGSRRQTSARQMTRRTLVAAEVALAVILASGAGLLLRSVERLLRVPPGFDSSHLLTMEVQVSSHLRFPDDDALRRFYARALEAVRRVAGVKSAAFTSHLPLSAMPGAAETYGIHFEGDGPASEYEALRCAVTPGYFETMRIPLVRGRLFDSRDLTPGSARPVLINESFARRRFHAQDPIGQRLRFGGPANRPFDIVAGVVGDVKQMSLAAGQTDTMYVVGAQWLWADNPLSLVVQAEGSAAALAPAIKKAIWSVDKDQPVLQVATMDSLITASAAERRFTMILFEVFAAAALALAAVGIFGVVAGSVTERLREIGVRAALGASPGEIVGLFIRQGMALTGVGILIGLGGAAAASSAVASLLFGISRFDPVTYLSVVAVLACVATCACSIPALRAARIDPSMTLRSE
jgi:putative ABC transport system permease protein